MSETTQNVEITLVRKRHGVLSKRVSLNKEGGVDSHGSATGSGAAARYRAAC